MQWMWSRLMFMFMFREGWFWPRHVSYFCIHIIVKILLVDYDRVNWSLWHTSIFILRFSKFGESWKCLTIFSFCFIFIIIMIFIRRLVFLTVSGLNRMFLIFCVEKNEESLIFSWAKTILLCTPIFSKIKSTTSTLNATLKWTKWISICSSLSVNVSTKWKGEFSLSFNCSQFSFSLRHMRQR